MPARYSKAQLVAYHTPTFYGSAATMPKSTSTIPGPILALSDPDAKSRAMRMYLVACWAAAMSKVDRSSSTLKIFLAPEFYFKAASSSTTQMGKGIFARKSGKYGAYSFNGMISLMEALHQSFCNSGRGDLFKDWLIVPGSIVSDLPADGKSYSKKGDEFYLNTVPIIKGEDKGYFGYVQKYLVSGIDGPPTTNGVFSGTGSPYAATLRKLEESGLDIDKDRVFTADGISFALDVCLDHAKAVAWNRSGITQAVDIHLVTSCGIELTEEAIVAKAGGWAMSCDGIANNSFPRSDCRKVTSRTTTKGILGPSLWDCRPDSGTPPDRWRSAEPALVGKVRSREPMIGNLKIEYPKEVTVYRNGVGTKVPKNHISDGMFPEEVVFYEPVGPL